jgi:hypothetical protein
MKRRFGIIVFFLVAAALGFWGHKLIADDSEYGGVKAKGVVFNIAPDRQVINTGGIYEPEGLDIYLRRHIDRLYEEIGVLRDQVKELNQGIKEIRALVSKLPQGSSSEKSAREV